MADEKIPTLMFAMPYDTIEEEIAVLGLLSRVLNGRSPDSQRRLLTWLNDRYLDLSV